LVEQRGDGLLVPAAHGGPERLSRLDFRIGRRGGGGEETSRKEDDPRECAAHVNPSTEVGTWRTTIPRRGAKSNWLPADRPGRLLSAGVSGWVSGTRSPLTRPGWRRADLSPKYGGEV